MQFEKFGNAPMACLMLRGLRLLPNAQWSLSALSASISIGWLGCKLASQVAYAPLAGLGLICGWLGLPDARAGISQTVRSLGGVTESRLLGGARG